MLEQNLYIVYNGIDPSSLSHAVSYSVGRDWFSYLWTLGDDPLITTQPLIALDENQMNDTLTSGNKVILENITTPRDEPVDYDGFNQEKKGSWKTSPHRRMNR
ncbi:hypothetical protein RF11_01433 [Thelohanellus kitauei]|uniref:Uncharacterized protein n=1 Tax=Thelohanellus kitauei TaxID=669202 RepID=A0A0C2M918_THEKT|nr:hypothetical protein RF11_01433 [Thelohanellus kitauei]